MSSLDSWSTVTLSNYNKKCQETKRYGHYRLLLGQYCSKLLTQLKNVWWLDAGNLLGAYRDGKMIAHDTDFDIGVLATDEEFTQLHLTLSDKVFENFKIRKIDTFCHRLQICDPHHGGYVLDHVHKVMFHNVTVNIQQYRIQSKNRVKIMYFKDDFCDQVPLTIQELLPLGTIKYCGHKFNSPHQVRQYLETYYEYLGLGAEYDKVTRKYRQNVDIPKDICNKRDRGDHEDLKNE